MPIYSTVLFLEIIGRVWLVGTVFVLVDGQLRYLFSTFKHKVHCFVQPKYFDAIIEKKRLISFYPFSFKRDIVAFVRYNYFSSSCSHDYGYIRCL